MNHITNKILLGSLIAVAVGCSSIDCAVDGSVRCVYSVVDAAGKTDSVPGFVSVTSARRTNGSDTTIINLQSQTTSLSLPMSFSELADTLYLIQSDTVDGVYIEKRRDTMWIEKTNTPHFESVDCSPRFFHTLTRVSSTHHIIDTLIINRKEVTNDKSTPNIHLHLRSDL